MTKFIKTLQFLSLDVVFGTVVCSIAFWKLPLGQGQINWPSVCILGVSTWIVYIADRLLDLRLYPINQTERHLFHQQNKKNLKILLSVLLIVALCICFILPVPILEFGFTYCLFLVGYFVALNFILKKDKFQWMKEIATAFFYSLAVFLPSFIMQPSINLSGYFLAFLFFLLVFQNLILFSYFETLENQKSKNIASKWGIEKTKTVIKSICVFIVVFVGILFFNGIAYPNLFAFILAIMSSIFLYISLQKDYFLMNDRYRLADLVFLLPLFLFLFF